MMDINVLTQLIGTLGFPITCCCYLFWENHNQRERHAEKEAALTAAINSMTVAVERLTAKLEDKENEL